MGTPFCLQVWHLVQAIFGARQCRWIVMVALSDQWLSVWWCVHRFNIGQIQSLPVMVEDVKTATCSESLQSVPLCSKWVARQHPSAFQIQAGIRVIIPAKLQSPVLQSLHMGHLGITWMKAIIHSYFWWNGLDQVCLWVLSSSKVFSCSSPTTSVGLAWCPMETSPCKFCWSFPW